MTTYYIARCPKCKWQQRYPMRPKFGNPTDSEGVRNGCPFCHAARLKITKEPVRK